MLKCGDLLTENHWIENLTLRFVQLLTYFWCISDQAYVDGSYYEDTNEAGFLEAATKSLEQTWSDMSAFFWKTIDEGKISYLISEKYKVKTL